MSSHSDSVLDAFFDQAANHGENIQDRADVNISITPKSKSSFSASPSPELQAEMTEELDKDDSPRTYVPAPPAKDPTGFYGKAYNRFIPTSIVGAARSAEGTTAPTARMSSQETRTTPVATPSENHLRASKQRHLSHGTPGLEEDGPSVSPTARQQGSASRNPKQFAQQHSYNFASRGRSTGTGTPHAQAKVNRASSAFPSEYDDEEIDDESEGELIYSPAFARYGNRLQSQRSSFNRSRPFGPPGNDSPTRRDGQDEDYDDQGLFLPQDDSVKEKERQEPTHPIHTPAIVRPSNRPHQLQSSPFRRSNSSSPPGNEVLVERYEDEDHDGQELFLSRDSSLSRSERQEPTPPPLFGHEHFIKKKKPINTRAIGSRKRKAVDEPEEEIFNNFGRNLAPSRYSGAQMPWGMNQEPPVVPQAAVSDAALLKRNLQRGKEDEVCKRGYGANDPENIAIVNMRESGRMNFKEIVEKLNKERIQNGRKPELSVCGVTARYSRTAPLLFAAEGKQFIPLAKRGRRGLTMADIDLEGIPVRPQWDNETDVLLVQVYKDDEKMRWTRVAEEFNRRVGSDRRPIDASSAARRHTML